MKCSNNFRLYTLAIKYRDLIRLFSDNYRDITSLLFAYLGQIVYFL
jgi:hypothetical protein